MFHNKKSSRGHFSLSPYKAVREETTVGTDVLSDRMVATPR